MVASDEQQWAINHRWLVWVYVVVPMSVLVVAVDIFFFNQVFQPYLSLSLLYLPLYLFIFELPHIIASLTSFADKEYLAHYRHHIFLVLPVMIAVFSLISWLMLPLAVVIYTCYTIYHVIRQQTGIALVFTKRRDWWHELWNYAGVVVGSSGMLIIISREFYGGVGLLPATVLLIGAVTVFTLVSMYILFRVDSTIARWYVLGVSVSVFVSFGFFILNYLFLAVFVLRFVHDVTAFMFYIVHDVNRNRETAHNMVYRIFKQFGIPIMVAVPVFAILVAVGIRAGTSPLSLGVFVVMMIGIVHYYLESVMWKRSAPHRARVHFS